MKTTIVAIILLFSQTSAHQSNHRSHSFFLRKSFDPYCSNYDNGHEKCKKCYTGFYLNVKGTCQKNSPLCFRTDKFGDCEACFKNYVLLHGKCFNKAVMDLEENDRSSADPLCSKWLEEQCVECSPGTYESNIQGKCKFEDPKCQIFDYEREICRICDRGYRMKKDRCVRRY